MNGYALVILAALLADFALSTLSRLLNLKRLQDSLPTDFEGVYDARSYERSQAYTRANTRLALILSSFNLAIILLFWFAGGFNALDQVIRGWGWGPLCTGLVYIAVLGLAKAILSLPFSFYDTFILEARFGFNQTTLRTFVLDLLKSLLLAVIIGGPLLAGILAFFQYSGKWAWLICWATSILFALFIQYIAPVWIMPLFNKFSPLPEGDLRQQILAYAAKIRFPLQGVYVMDGSKRSTKSNAFFTGFGRNKRITLFDTLVARHTTAELLAVLAHEMGHYKLKHILKGLVISILHTGILFLLLSIFLRHQGLFAAFYMQDSSIYAGLLFFAMLYAPVELILGPLFHWISRRHEYQADRYVIQTLGDGRAMISALKKLALNNLTQLTPHPLHVFLHYSHPPVLERIAALKSKLDLP